MRLVFGKPEPNLYILCHNSYAFLLVKALNLILIIYKKEMISCRKKLKEDIKDLPQYLAHNSAK